MVHLLQLLFFRLHAGHALILLQFELISLPFALSETTLCFFHPNMAREWYLVCTALILLVNVEFCC
jgi:hypothetical protein